MMRINHLTGAAAVLFLLGCGSSSSSGASGSSNPDGTNLAGTGTLSGSVAGVTFTPMDGFFSTNTQGSTSVVLSSYAGDCKASNENIRYPGTYDLSIEIGNSSTVGDAAFVVASFYNTHQDANKTSCGVGNVGPNNGTSKSGSVTLKTASATELAGDYTITFGSDTIMGSFDVPFCAPESNAPTNPNDACTPPP